MNYLLKTNRKKKQIYLIISASGILSGVKFLLLEVNAQKWQILNSQSIHYPKQIRELFQQITNKENSTHSLENLAGLEYRISRFILETANNFLLHIPKIKHHLDFIIFKKFTLWKDNIQYSKHHCAWNIRIGDAQMLAYYFKKPVLTDFIRQDILEKGEGIIPALYGDLEIAKTAGDIGVFLDIGSIAHIIAIDSQMPELILDSDTGPGTCLIDMTATDAGCTHGFDRDGLIASSGNVNTDILEQLLSDNWLRQPQPKQAKPEQFKNLLNDQCLKGMSQKDIISTITAFTALTINDFYKREYTFDKKPKIIWVSGGGTNNLSLLEFLGAYFSPISIKNIEELGIPHLCKPLLSLGLSVHAYLNKRKLAFPGCVSKRRKHFFRWVIPE